MPCRNDTLMEKAGYLLPANNGSGCRKRLAAFAIDDLTAEEEEELLKYLAVPPLPHFVMTSPSEPSSVTQARRVRQLRYRPRPGALRTGSSLNPEGRASASRAVPSSRPTADAWAERVRLRIRDADEVIAICGEHTEAVGRA
jgi:hypothetical protein